MSAAHAPPHTPLHHDDADHAAQLRPLASGDYARGHLDVLRALTSVPDVGEAAWEGRFAEMRDAQPRAYYPLVLVEQGRIVATGTLFLERKFIRALGAAGHIEDIAVDKSQQGKGLGRVIIAALTAVSEAVGAYKTILDCSEENQREWQRLRRVKRRRVKRQGLRAARSDVRSLDGNEVAGRVRHGGAERCETAVRWCCR